MTSLNRRSLLAAGAAGAAWGALPVSRARAQAANTIKIGVLNDQSGIYSYIAGPNGEYDWIVIDAPPAFAGRGAYPIRRPRIRRAITRRWTWLVPSPISVSLASRR